ncbi:MAG: Uma2 family endonuclease [Actinomycetota bacterium]
MSSLTRGQIALAEYLARERATESKHEYSDGEVFAMPACSAAHSRIGANLICEITGVLRDGPCVTYSSHLRLRIPATGLYTPTPT